MKTLGSQDIIGQKFGLLTVLERTEDHISRSGRKYRQYLCQCECGGTFIAYPFMLTSGKTWHCGCVTNKHLPRGEARHGDADPKTKWHRLYGLWHDMKNRCYNTKDKGYQRYGARGIRVCEEWLNDYSAFKKWALSHGYDIDAPRGVCTLDRIDFNGDYCPDNCRFVDTATQNDNKSNVIHVEFNGETHNLKQWAEIIGVNLTTLVQRYHTGYRGEELLSPKKLPTRKPRVNKEE